MGILTEHLPPRRERVARRTIAVMAYGGAFLLVLCVCSTFLWVYLPSPDVAARIAWLNGRHDLLSAAWERSEPESIEAARSFWVDYGNEIKRRQSLHTLYLTRWFLLQQVGFGWTVVSPLLAWMLWSSAVRPRNRLLATVAVREELAMTAQTAEEILRARLVEPNAAGLRSFLITIPAVWAAGLLMLFVCHLPEWIEPLRIGLQTASDWEDGLALAIVALAYASGLLFLVRFLAPFMMLNTLILRCVPRLAPDAALRIKGVAMSRLLVIIALIVALLCMMLGGFWIQDGIRRVLLTREMRQAFTLWSFFAAPFYQRNLFLFAASAAVLILLPPWALRRVWRQAVEGYFRFE